MYQLYISMVNLLIKAFPNEKNKKKMSENHMVTMICMFPLNFSNLRDEDVYKIVTNLFYWGVFCIYGISAGDSTENFPRFGPSVVSTNSVFVPLHSLWRWDWTFIYIASDTGMMFSVVSFSTQGEMNLPAYLHPVAIKPYFNEKMNIWTLHFSQQCSISGSCAFYSLTETASMTAARILPFCSAFP